MHTSTTAPIIAPITRPAHSPSQERIPTPSPPKLFQDSTHASNPLPGFGAFYPSPFLGQFPASEQPKGDQWRRPAAQSHTITSAFDISPFYHPTEPTAHIQQQQQQQSPAPLQQQQQQQRHWGYKPTVPAKLYNPFDVPSSHP